MKLRVLCTGEIIERSDSTATALMHASPGEYEPNPVEIPVEYTVIVPVPPKAPEPAKPSRKRKAP